jgi:sugar phosphate isomerase/epimerase
MTTAKFTLSAFADEIDNDLATQLEVLDSEGVTYVEFRSAWGRNVLDLDAAQLQEAAALLKQYRFRVSAIGSPIGKSELAQPREFEMERLERAIAAAKALDTYQIRVFSFYVRPSQATEHRAEVIERMRALTERAAEAGLRLLHENEKDIYGDTGERCYDLLSTINLPALRMAFDPANFVQVGVRPMVDAWPLLADCTTHIHIKDAVFADGSVRPAGEGDGDLPGLLDVLVRRGYRGFLTLEPHLKIAGPSGGFSGEEGMRTAIRALRKLLAAHPDVPVA